MRNKRAGVLAVLMIWTAGSLWAKSGSGIRGRILDPSGAAIVGATVIVTSVESGASRISVTDSGGAYEAEGLPAVLYDVTAEKSGFATQTKQVTLRPGHTGQLDFKLAIQKRFESVEVHATAPGATLKPTQEQILKSNQTIRVLGRRELDAVGALAGAGQIVAMAPGANVVSYGNTGGTKSTIALNGINQGWGGYGGYNYPGSLDVTLDGMPLPDAATGLWASGSLPQTKMFQNVNVTYGPGTPINRFYTDVGGAFDFVPIQPTTKRHIDGTVSFGSYGQKNLELNMFTGDLHGWSTVVSGGMGKGDSFRQAADGFTNPDKDGAIFAKTTKSFDAGSFSLGGYYARSGGYRAQIIPTTDVPTLTIDGLGANAVDYSQPTSGFYSTLPYNSYNKYDVNELAVIYAKETFVLSGTTIAENDTWYTHEFRFHERKNDLYVTGTQLEEWNDPHHNTVGDRFVISKTFHYNKASVGGYFLHDLYNSRNNFFNPADGGSGEGHIINIGGKFRSSYFDQDDYTAFVQDDFMPIPRVHITPGVRFDRFHNGYYSGALQDFSFAPGVVVSMHCPDPAQDNTNATDPTYNPNVNTKNQSADCGMNASKTAIEPSISAAVEPTDWLTLYGGYTKTYRSPSLGGGGGLFQSLDPRTSYLLADAGYSQVGFKFHKQEFAGMRDVLFGASYFHLQYDHELLGIELGNGNFVNANGNSHYQGVNSYIDFDPSSSLHLFTNLTGQGATFDQFYVQNPLTNAFESFAGLPVSYVPDITWNTGAYYHYSLGESVAIEPRVWFNYNGSQHIYDNCVANASGSCTNSLPSNRTMPAFDTLNLSVKVPYRHLSFEADMLNVLDNQYNIYEYVSSGGYYGTSTAGYTFAYPGAPFTIYASLGFHF